VQEVTPNEIVKAITPYFPDDDPVCLASAIARYKNAGLWNQTPVLSEIGLERLRAGLLSNSFIKRDVPYDEVVDTRFD